MSWKIKLIRVIVMLFLTIGSYCDIKTRKLPMGFLLLFAGVGIYLNLMWKYQNMETLVLGVSFGVMFFVISKVTEEAIGYGDAWGILILGILEGGRKIVPIVFTAFIFSSIYGLYKMITSKMRKRDSMPFFPFMFLAVLGAWMR